jgi:hypothetical protein
MPFDGGAAYAMSKAALIVKGLARNFGPRGSAMFSPAPSTPR